MSERNRIRNAAGALVAGAIMIGTAVTLAGGALSVTGDAVASALSVGQTPSASLVLRPYVPHPPIIKG